MIRLVVLMYVRFPLPLWNVKDLLITTDGLRSYRDAMNEFGNADEQEVGCRASSRVENSPLLL